VEYGVGQYDSDWNKIEAEWYMQLEGAAKKTENLRYGFDVECTGDLPEKQGVLYYPNIRNVEDKVGMAFFASCDCEAGGVIEVWKQGDQNGDEKLIGTCHINLIRPHSWRTYRMYTCLLEEIPTDKLSIKLVLKVNGQGSMRLDYFKFFKSYEC